MLIMEKKFECDCGCWCSTIVPAEDYFPPDKLGKFSVDCREEKKCGFCDKIMKLTELIFYRTVCRKKAAAFMRRMNCVLFHFS